MTAYDRFGGTVIQYLWRRYETITSRVSRNKKTFVHRCRHLHFCIENRTLRFPNRWPINSSAYLRFGIAHTLLTKFCWLAPEISFMLYFNGNKYFCVFHYSFRDRLCAQCALHTCGLGVWLPIALLIQYLMWHIYYNVNLTTRSLFYGNDRKLKIRDFLQATKTYWYRQYRRFLMQYMRSQFSKHHWIIEMLESRPVRIEPTFFLNSIQVLYPLALRPEFPFFLTYC